MYGRADYWEPGTWNIVCSMCGRKRKAAEVVRNWQGLYRCVEHDEPRQPQDFARGVPEHMEVPFAQVPTGTFVPLTINPNLPASSLPPDPRQGAAGGFSPPPFVNPVEAKHGQDGMASESGQDIRSADGTG